MEAIIIIVVTLMFVAVVCSMHSSEMSQREE
jgi:hypothetical protein